MQTEVHSTNELQEVRIPITDREVIMTVSKSTGKKVTASQARTKKVTKPKTSEKTKTKGATKAKADERRVTFACHHPDAREVFLAGEFTDWDACLRPLEKSGEGIWRITVHLLPGRYEYNFIVDGNWIQDMLCAEMVPNPFGTRNSVIVVE
jgi:1,4-alpha-glucan branching enzyme